MNYFDREKSSSRASEWPHTVEVVGSHPSDFPGLSQGTFQCQRDTLGDLAFMGSSSVHPLPGALTGGQRLHEKEKKQQEMVKIPAQHRS